MAPRFSKTPLLIAAIATAVTFTALGPASAGTYWAKADGQTATVIDADLKIKKFKVRKFHAPKHDHGYKHHGAAKKKHVSKSHIKNTVILKKLF